MSVTESKAKAPVKTSKKSVNPAESAALKAALEAAQVEMVPLSALLFAYLSANILR
jgi:ParB family chromosome partitioning protein